jgi:hypothetical protein
LRGTSTIRERLGVVGGERELPDEVRDAKAVQRGGLVGAGSRARGACR